MRALLLGLAVLCAGCGTSDDVLFTAASGAGGAGSAGSATSSGTTATSSSASAGGATSSSTSTTSGGGGGNACGVYSDCPGDDTACAWRTCTSGACGVSHAPDGTAVQAQTAGDCQAAVCDGSGGVKGVPEDVDTPSQVLGDCAALSCSGGAVVSSPDTKDVTVDADECTDDVCTNGAPDHPLFAAGTPCSAGLCDAEGACVAHIPVKCSTSGGVFAGCDGFIHGCGLTIFWGNGPEGGSCNGVPQDVGYCPPGTECGASCAGGPAYAGTCL